MASLASHRPVSDNNCFEKMQDLFGWWAFFVVFEIPSIFFLWIWSYYLMFFWGEFLIAEAKLEKHNTKPFAELFCCLMLNFVKNQLMTFVLVELNVIWSIRIHFGELVPFFSHSFEEEKVTPLSSPSAVLQILGKWMIKDWRNAQGVTGIALASSELVSWCWNPKALLTEFRSSFVKPVGSRN